MVTGILLILFAVSALYILEPLFKTQIQGDFQHLFGFQNLEIQKRLVLEGIKDLELDHMASKIDEADYLLLRNDLMDEGTKIIKEIESSEVNGNRRKAT